MDNTADLYRKLQQHLDSMPVGFPATTSGVELRLLKLLFTPDQARIALALDYRFKTADQIRQQLSDMGLTLQEMESRLEEMVEAGNTFSKIQSGTNVYANMPLAVGMWELQASRLTPELLSVAGEYMRGEFGQAFVGTKVPQVRVIPVGKSIRAEHRISTYDELRSVIENAEGRIRVGECLCREAMRLNGRSCSVTSRKETCMGFRDFGDLMGRSGWGRPISTEEALEIASQNEKEGLVLEAGNEQEVQFICSCCGDCCGVLKGIKALLRPADHIATNFCARVEPYHCNGCGICADRCQMDAIVMRDDIAVVKDERCIGCGLCVPTCPGEAIQLERKGQELAPPKDMEALYETIMEGKRWE